MAANAKIIVNEFSVKPNYALAASDNDKVKLTDGYIDKYPMWTKKSAVVWKDISPIRINLKTSGYNNKQGRLVIYSSVGRHAGVYPIERVDVYSAGENKIHLGRYQRDKLEKILKNNYKVTINLSEVTELIEVIFHVKKGYLVIGEIELDSSIEPAILKIGELGHKNSMLDSSNKLKSEYLKGASGLPKEEENLTISEVDCYADFYEIKKRSLTKKSIFKVISDEESKIDYCFYVKNVKNKKMDIGVEVFSKENIEKAKVYEIDSIMTRAGTVVYDPLVKLDGNKTIKEPGEHGFFWVEIKGGRPGYDVEIKINEDLYNVAIEAQDFKCKKNKSIKYINLWSYSTSIPIWDDKKSAVSFLRENSVNIFLVSPKLMPKLKEGGDWSTQERNIIDDEIDLYGRLGHDERLIFFTGWRFGRDIEKRVLGTLSDVDKKNINSWVNSLANQLVKKGYDWNDFVPRCLRSISYNDYNTF